MYFGIVKRILERILGGDMAPPISARYRGWLISESAILSQYRGWKKKRESEIVHEKPPRLASWLPASKALRHTEQWKAIEPSHGDLERHFYRCYPRPYGGKYAPLGHE